MSSTPERCGQTLPPWSPLLDRPRKGDCLSSSISASHFQTRQTDPLAGPSRTVVQPLAKMLQRPQSSKDTPTESRGFSNLIGREFLLSTFLPRSALYKT